VWFQNLAENRLISYQIHIISAPRLLTPVCSVASIPARAVRPWNPIGVNERKNYDRINPAEEPCKRAGMLEKFSLGSSATSWEKRGL